MGGLGIGGLGGCGESPRDGKDMDKRFKLGADPLSRGDCSGEKGLADGGGLGMDGRGGGALYGFAPNIDPREGGTRGAGAYSSSSSTSSCRFEAAGGGAKAAGRPMGLGGGGGGGGGGPRAFPMSGGGPRAA